MILRQPIPHARRQQEVLVPVTRQEVLRHHRSLLNGSDRPKTYATASFRRVLAAPLHRGEDRVTKQHRFATQLHQFCAEGRNARGDVAPRCASFSGLTIEWMVVMCPSWTLKETTATTAPSRSSARKPGWPFTRTASRVTPHSCPWP